MGRNPAAAKPAYATLDELLMALVEEGLTSRKGIAHSSHRSHDAAGDWVRGESEPRFTELQLLLQNLEEEAASRILALLLCCTRFDHVLRGDADGELDVNGDGRVDLADALDSAINAMKAGQAALERVREAQRGDQLSTLSADAIVAEILRGSRCGQVVVQVLTKVIGNNGRGMRVA